MRIKSFKGRTTAETLEQVKNEMGPEAMILQTRPTREKGMMGLFGTTGVEIVAGVDDAPIRKSAAPARPPEVETLHRKLVAQGIEPQFAMELLEDVQSVSQGLPPAEKGRLTSALASVLGGKLRTTGGLRHWANDQRVVAFIGPTGVGKTTTIAKIAAGLVLRARRRIEIVTIDAHRVGAIEQLKSYGELLGVPVHAAYTPGELADFVGRASRAEMILIDTPGCSYHDKAALVELDQYFRTVPNIEVNVLLSCCWKTDDAINAANAFRPVGQRGADSPSRKDSVQLLFTKADETSSYGSMLAVPLKTRLPLSYICNGQEVPDDINVTSSQLIANMLTGTSPAAREVRA